MHAATIYDAGWDDKLMKTVFLVPGQFTLGITPPGPLILANDLA